MEAFVHRLITTEIRVLMQMDDGAGKRQRAERHLSVKRET
jgi:hypothetical protein